MDTFVTVMALLALIVLGAFLIHRLNAQHGERISAFPYGRSGSAARGPAPPTERKARSRAHGANDTNGRRDHRDGGCGPLRPRRTRKSPT
ncbi:hypothetical protein ACIF8T_34960 [Streptomyces sp. NPDC085946]|uniref:hypothetical protein n=1 Tax=Streptomyces sp. NPDC085946 TaxID=3365744 RepID=UPI0037CFAC1C